MVKKFVNISELANILKLKNDKTGKLKTYILRFWEKKFKQIKPNKFSNNRRFYSHSQVKLLKLINYLLNERGLSIKNAKIILKNNINDLDDYHLSSVKADYIKKSLKEKSLNILNKLSKYKKNGKKNSH